MTPDRILVVEDDPNLLKTLEYNLRREGYEVVTAADGSQAVAAARRDSPALIVLDVMLPEMSGFEVCRIVRQTMTVPILMLTARGDETDRVIGLDVGADDYVTKPFGMRELMARIRAMLRRATMAGVEASGLLRSGDIEIDAGRHRACLRGQELSLTPKEYDLLTFLTRNKGLVFGREQLLERVWGYDYGGDTRTVDVHVRWLRRKIEDDPSQPARLVTVRGAGYKLTG